jgi:hypothetical protein
MTDEIVFKYGARILWGRIISGDFVASFVQSTLQAEVCEALGSWLLVGSNGGW